MRGALAGSLGVGSTSNHSELFSRKPLFKRCISSGEAGGALYTNNESAKHSKTGAFVSAFSQGGILLLGIHGGGSRSECARWKMRCLQVMRTEEKEELEIEES